MDRDATQSSNNLREGRTSLTPNQNRPPPIRRGFWAVLIFILVPLLGLIILSLFSQRRPPETGLVGGTLRACPNSPNCVSSLAESQGQRVSPLPMVGDHDKSVEMLTQVIENMPRASVVTVAGPYVHAEFQTRLLRFVDDVEFLIDSDAQVIHVRSASRSGHSDFGVNRQRVEVLRREIQSWTKPSEKETL